MKKCEHCRELIDDEADKCPHCGAWQEGYQSFLRQEWEKEEAKREKEEAKRKRRFNCLILLWAEIGYLLWLPISEHNDDFWMSLIWAGLASFIVTFLINLGLQKFPIIKWALIVGVFTAWVLIFYWKYTDELMLALIIGFVGSLFHIPLLLDD